MLMLSWNVQGLGRPLTFQILRGLCSTHRPMVVFLMETKNKRPLHERIQKALHFNNNCYVDPEGTSGGLALWWTDEVSLDIRYKSKNMIRAIVSSPAHKFEWVVSFVYGPPKRKERALFWNLFIKMSKNITRPWLCVGDFNEVGFVTEKQGGAECSSGRIEKFQSVMSECALLDLDFKGNAFTLSNNQIGNACVRERIDRAMANLEWRHKFSCAQVFHEVILGSDHCPLIINCDVPLQKVPKLFKFESMWATHPNCEPVIVSSWNTQVAGSDMFKLVRKLKKCRTHLSRWSKEEFGNNRIKLNSLKEQLAILQSKDPLEVNYFQQQHLKSEIEILLAREEMYYHQRSRVRWLQYGDRNTALFHASLIQRRQRNQLLRLKSDSGTWLTTDTEINSELKGYFQQLFQSDGHPDMDEALSHVSQVITPAMNSKEIMINGMLTASFSGCIVAKKELKYD
ncbi:hypothetical protein Vadar_001340 [Vaccinium darrowii]|uniref:Uncharacterized protein n=1 Tax=Vaccinium darrowii TaxID=229202 RepID=A0ACB7XER6_9ERIC|nr:hypothetical protein Vadar_001340 [Vaccinium darrowii]